MVRMYCENKKCKRRKNGSEAFFVGFTHYDILNVKCELCGRNMYVEIPDCLKKIYDCSAPQDNSL